MKRNLLLLFAVLLTALTASAQIYFPFEYNGINYVQIGENQVQVVGSGSGGYLCFYCAKFIKQQEQH